MIDEATIELKLKTNVGELTAVFISSPINCYANIYTAWFKEKPGVIVQANSIHEAIDELYTSLELMIEVENMYDYE